MDDVERQLAGIRRLLVVVCMLLALLVISGETPPDPIAGPAALFLLGVFVGGPLYLLLDGLGALAGTSDGTGSPEEP